MSLADVCLWITIVGLTAYAVFGGADFGGGFWDLVAGASRTAMEVRGLILRSMTPVWEANHVWLIFVLVVVWTAFPLFFGSVMSSLYVPMFLAAAGIIFRGTAFAMRGQARTLAEGRAIGAAFALSSVLVPFCLGASLGAIGSGRVPVGNALAAPFDSWLNPTSILVGVLAVLTGAYLAAVFLAADSAAAGLRTLEEAFRARALAGGVVTGVIAVGGLFVLRSDARDLYDGLTSGTGLVLVLASGVFGAVTLALIAARRYEPARWTSAGAVGCITFGWAAAQSPYLLPGKLTLTQAAAPHSTLVALLISLAGGGLVLIPSLVLLYRLVLRGRLFQEFEPIDAGYEEKPT